MRMSMRTTSGRSSWAAAMAASPSPASPTTSKSPAAVAAVAGAAFAVVGAGIGAALGNSPAGLTGTYLTMLGVMPILSVFKPTWAENLDPTTAVVMLAQAGVETRSVLVLAGWVVVSTVLGAVITGRRAVH